MFSQSSIEIELACATCHLIFEQEMFDTLSEKEPEEDDMLDLAMELTDTSRLGCQICVREDTFSEIYVYRPNKGAATISPSIVVVNA